MFSLAQYQALHESAGALERRDRGLLRLTGADRRNYLQGLLTNDILALQPGTGCYAAMLTAQGRMITDMRVLALEDAVLVDLPSSLTPMIRDRLNQFVFTEDVVVSDVSESLVQLGVYGPRAPDVLVGALERLKSPQSGVPRATQLRSMRTFENAHWDVGDNSALIIRSDDFGLLGFDLCIDRTSAASVMSALLDSGAVSIEQEALEVCRIEAGRPAFGRDMNEETIPLEAGIEDRAISQTKGCYVGQEIIIRVLHRGHGRVVRRLVGLLVDGSEPSPGDRISSHDRDVGFVTSAAHSPALGRPVALGYVHRDLVTPGTTVTLGSGERAMPAVVSALPLVPRQVESTRS
jgi:folate-binding protein YgfZ